MPRTRNPKFGEPKLPVRPLDMAVLLFHIYEAAKTPDLAQVDADYTIDGLTREMKRKPALIAKSKVESALYCCNLLSEVGRFWHPEDKDFKQFIDGLEGEWWRVYQFDKFSNLLIKK